MFYVSHPLFTAKFSPKNASSFATGKPQNVPPMLWLRLNARRPIHFARRKANIVWREIKIKGLQFEGISRLANKFYGYIQL